MNLFVVWVVASFFTLLGTFFVVGAFSIPKDFPSFLEPLNPPGFQDFLDANGCQYDGTTLALCTSSSPKDLSDTNGATRGIYATKSFEAGDVVCSIPLERAAILVEEEETNDAIRGSKFYAWTQEQDSNNKWKSYLDLLPTMSDHFHPPPNFWTDEQVQELELPELVEEVEQRQRDLQAVTVEGSGLNPDDLLQTLRFYSWLLSSRSFSLIEAISEDEVLTRCYMVPYTDMINHCSEEDPNCQLDIQEDGEDLIQIVQATKPIGVGDELALSYGSGEDESMDLLLNYGFVPKTNAQDVETMEEDDFEWSTSLEDDIRELQGISPTDSSIRRTILQFRIKMKRAIDGHTSMS